MSGTLYGVGVGPGDPELLTLKAVRILRGVPVIAYPAPLRGDGMARAIAAPHLPGGQREIVMRMSFDPAEPRPEAAYDEGAAAVAAALAAGEDVAVLCEGDPLLFGSFAYLLARLAGRVPVVVVPAVSSILACAAAVPTPLALGDEALAVVPATRPAAEIAGLLARVEAAAVMKLGRHLPKIRAILRELGLEQRAWYVEWAGTPRQRAVRLIDLAETTAPYFAMVLVRKEE